MVSRSLQREVRVRYWSAVTIIRALFWSVASFSFFLQPASSSASPGIVYTNIVAPSEPWSIHVVKVDRAGSKFEIHAPHANRRALGLSKLREQVAAVDAGTGNAVAALNGGFYRRDSAYAGGARGLQIVAGEVISAPAGNVCFWVDIGGEPHLTNVTSRFQFTTPEGKTAPFGLNEERKENGIVLYTPALGSSTLTTNGLELVLERAGHRWLPLRMGQHYSARVREIRSEGNTPLSADVMVLSFGPAAARQFGELKTNSVLQISTASSPSLSLARVGLSGGPVLIRNGKRQKIQAEVDAAYEFSSMLEQHPRSAIGWNDTSFFLVEVDGRQKDLSVGMTLDELSTFLAKLGCTEAMNLDGGGSSTLWYDGEVKNNPCDGYERTIANSLVITKKGVKNSRASSATISESK
ncbi:MAG TPA: phosphodiester glycosidase family protein [Verrucomicrobiae bacterium]|nr:phosphodiester glycosidase family protein [Verrucomicrobiae bacterium]